MSSSGKGKNGILPVNSAILKKGNPPTNPKVPPRNLPRLRLIIRRLPPGLTETEFWTCIGSEWKVAAGKIDWAVFKEGKVSKDPSKPSRPARAYLRVKEQSFLDGLSANVKQTTFQDAKNTTKDSCLLGPPSLEFAPLNKNPGGRVRHDGRQGTIDQDQEFIDFLQSLTEPITRPVTGVVDGSESKTSAVTTTPLIQYIKDKKATKAKESALAKSSKGKLDTKDAKATKNESKGGVVIKNANPTVAEKARVAKATQDTVKAINKSVASMQSKLGAPKVESKASTTKTTETPQTPVKRERERGSASVANRILQRDLGLTPKESKRDRVLRTTGPPEEADKVPKVSLPSTTTPDTVTKTQPQPPPPTPTSPRTSRAASITSNKSLAGAPQRSAKSLVQPSAGAKSAFLKHANPSQGITEELLRSAFETFGVLTRCEIDKKKGFGYVDFSESEGLKKAMQSSPVKVGNGQVVVLENKPKPQSKSSSSQAPANPALAATPKAEPSKAPVTTLVTAASTSASVRAEVAPSNAIPTAPRGSAKDAASTNRGGRGGNFASGRGSSGPSNRGATRGSSRGGRGGASQQNRGGGKGGNNTSSATPATTTTAPVVSSTTDGK